MCIPACCRCITPSASTFLFIFQWLVSAISPYTPRSSLSLFFRHPFLLFFACFRSLLFLVLLHDSTSTRRNIHAYTWQAAWSLLLQCVGGGWRRNCPQNSNYNVSTVLRDDYLPLRNFSGLSTRVFWYLADFLLCRFANCTALFDETLHFIDVVSSIGQYINVADNF